MAYIYVITNDINGKQYVGKTSDTIQQRFKIHLKDSQNCKNEQRPLYQAMNKYGIEHFYIKELEECSVEKASEKEGQDRRTANDCIRRCRKYLY